MLLYVVCLEAFCVPRLKPHCLVCLCRYSFGPALFVAWIGGAVLIAGGALSSLAVREMGTDGKARYDISQLLL